MTHSAPRTKTIQGSEDVIDTALRFLSRARTRIDICTKTLSPTDSDAMEMFVRPLLEAKQRGARLRLIGNVTKTDLGVLDRLVRESELRHLGTVNSYFGVSDTEFLGVPGTGDLI